MSSIKLKHSGGNSVSLNPPTSAPTSTEVSFKLPNADGSANQLIKTDGSGNLSFATVTDTNDNTWVKLATTTISSNVDNVTFTNSITGAFDTYNMYTMVFTGLRSTADDYNVYVRIQESGSTVDGNVYRYKIFSIDGNNSGQSANFFRCNFDPVGNSSSSDNFEDLNGIIYMTGFVVSRRFRFRSEIIYGGVDADNNFDFSGGGLNETNATTGVLIYPQNGQWSTGTVTLYGIAQ